MKLTALLDASSGAFVDPLRAVYEAAAVAIAALGELDVIRYEDTPTEGSADLGLWEELAPLLGATITSVNALLDEIDLRFPSTQTPPDLKTHGRIHQLMQSAWSELRTNVAAFGARARDPAVVGDPWNLIAELQSFRYVTRNRVGALVYDTAVILGECRRQEVDPGYGEELTHALAIRTATTELRRRLRDRLVSIGEALAEDVEWNAQQLSRELREFGKGKAWPVLRAQDKRKVLEFRKAVAEITRRDLKKAELGTTLKPFVEYVRSFKGINQRELLMEHDREVVAACGVAVERVMGLISTGHGTESVLQLHKILVYARATFGRSSTFDKWLRTMGEAKFTPADVPAACEQFLGLLAGLGL